MCSVKEIIDAFDLLFESLISDDFAKSRNFVEWNEQELLPLVRAFLLGCFKNKVKPEVQVRLPGTQSGADRIDFEIGNIAVEFAVRPRSSKGNCLSAAGNKDERKKLLLYPGRSVLVLFDFSREPYTEDELEDFRDHPLHGNYKKFPFNVAYFYLRPGMRSDYDLMQKLVRP
jgi:hypothetical protein